MATNPVQQAQQNIENAVLHHLQPTRNGPGIGAKAISEALGLFRLKLAGINDAYAYGAINSLYSQELIEPWPQRNGRGGWRIV